MGPAGRAKRAGLLTADALSCDALSADLVDLATIEHMVGPPSVLLTAGSPLRLGQLSSSSSGAHDSCHYSIGGYASELTTCVDEQTSCSSHDDCGLLDRGEFGCVFKNLKGEWTEQHLDQLFEAADSENKGRIRLEDSFRVLGEWSKA